MSSSVVPKRTGTNSSKNGSPIRDRAGTSSSPTNNSYNNSTANAQTTQNNYLLKQKLRSSLFPNVLETVAVHPVPRLTDYGFKSREFPNRAVDELGIYSKILGDDDAILVDIVLSGSGSNIRASAGSEGVMPGNSATDVTATGNTTGGVGKSIGTSTGTSTGMQEHYSIPSGGASGAGAQSRGANPSVVEGSGGFARDTLKPDNVSSESAENLMSDKVQGGNGDDPRPSAANADPPNRDTENTEDEYSTLNTDANTTLTDDVSFDPVGHAPRILKFSTQNQRGSFFDPETSAGPTTNGGSAGVVLAGGGEMPGVVQSKDGSSTHMNYSAYLSPSQLPASGTQLPAAGLPGYQPQSVQSHQSVDAGAQSAGAQGSAASPGLNGPTTGSGPILYNALLRAGPRAKLHFDPNEVTAAIVTCGGLCPGLNAVVHHLVNTLWNIYGVRWGGVLVFGRGS